jgi:hypothetical protein
MLLLIFLHAFLLSITLTMFNEEYNV